MVVQPRRWVFLAGLVVLGTTAACGPISVPLVQTDTDTTAPASASQSTAPVTAPVNAIPTATPATGPQTVPVRRDSITETVSLDGTVVAQSQAPVSFQQKGAVDKVDVKPGQAVSQGDTLVDLNGDDAQKTLDTANAQLQTAQTNLVQGQGQLQAMEDAATQQVATAQRQQQQTIADAQAGLRKAQDNLAQVQSGKIEQRAVRVWGDGSRESELAGCGGTGRQSTRSTVDRIPNAIAAAQKEIANDQIALSKAQADLTTLTNGPGSDAVRAAQAQVQKVRHSFNWRSRRRWTPRPTWL